MSGQKTDILSNYTIQQLPTLYLLYTIPLIVVNFVISVHVINVPL